MKHKRQGWITGLLCAFPLVMVAQQTEPLTGAQRLFDDGKILFERRDYAAARQTLERYLQNESRRALRDEADYMLACTAYELQLPDALRHLEDYLDKYPESRYRNRVLSLIGSVYFLGEHIKRLYRHFSK